MNKIICASLSHTLCWYEVDMLKVLNMDQPGKVANPTRSQQLNRKMNICLSPFAPENLVSRDGFGCPVPRQPLLILLTQAESAVLTGFLPFSAAASIYLYHREDFVCFGGYEDSCIIRYHRRASIGNKKTSALTSSL